MYPDHSTNTYLGSFINNHETGDYAVLSGIKTNQRRELVSGFRISFMSLILACSWPLWSLNGQDPTAARPVVGLRDNTPQNFALTNIEAIPRPGKSIPAATLLVEGSTITALGVGVKIPDGFKTIDLSGKRVYAGMIDAWSEVEVSDFDTTAGHWNTNITPHRSAVVAASQSGSDDKLRSQGITSRVLAPKGGIIKGQSCVVQLADSEHERLLKETAWQHLSLTVPRGSSSSRSRYPNSPMGAVALLRQTLHDASWYRDAWDTYSAIPSLPRPEVNRALASLADAFDNGGIFVVDAPNERMAIRADAIARQFSLPMILRGSGREYRALDELAETHRAILLPVDFPSAPDVKTTQASQKTTLQELMHWDLAPENPGRLADLGVDICLTTDGLDNLADFLKQVRLAVSRGLKTDDALAALTTTPAMLLGLDEHIGELKPGMLANFVVTDGDLFADDTEILECWVAGEKFDVAESESKASVEHLVGNWTLTFRNGRTNVSMQVEFARDKKSLVGHLIQPVGSEESEDESDAADRIKLANLVCERDRLSASIELREIEPEFSEGKSRLSLVTILGESEPTILGSMTLPNGQQLPVRVQRHEVKNEDAEQPEEDDADSDSEEESNESSPTSDSPTPIWYPLGAYGLAQAVQAEPTVLFRGATIWSCDELGVIEEADLLVRDGLIVEIGSKIKPPDGCVIVDARGKHITPGLIDCHSHMGTDGGINESGQAVTAEVRIGDFIDNSDIQIYRQLAGGLTSSNILHGSANPIGGQNQVIKLRWGSTMQEMKMKEAPGGIKFALGENVKRLQTRYPNSRMGVEQIIRDQLLAAREYQSKWRRWRDGERNSLPPRVDLQLEALAEVQRGERWIHCHSYRQDEIVATLEVLEEFGIQIGTLQHILEGYKVADRMAQHGAMGSSFSDWWAYKFEVFDAIPYNGALMHDRGVVVSFNSDDRELARHLNTEAAKATKYGGVSEEEALKFVTLNPAKQLRIDQFVGSLAVGKHADLAVWSGRPLSTLSRCEQTWIDGRRYFDLNEDQELRQRDSALRAKLIQKALAGKGGKKKSKREVEEEERWVRHDVYCSAHGGAKYEHEGVNK